MEKSANGVLLEAMLDNVVKRIDMHGAQMRRIEDKLDAMKETQATDKLELVKGIEAVKQDAIKESGKVSTRIALIMAAISFTGGGAGSAAMFKFLVH